MALTNKVEEKLKKQGKAKRISAKEIYYIFKPISEKMKNFYIEFTRKDFASYYISKKVYVNV